jgi:hypothetical protein
MSTTEIIEALPKLTEAERRVVRRRLLELAEENESVAACDQSATEAAQALDRLEQEDGGTS